MRTVGAILVALTAANAFAAEPATPYDLNKAPWPCWRGPRFNGSTKDQGIELIQDLLQAKLVWVSEDPIPGAYCYTAYWVGGHSSPIVAERRVYIAYSCPPGRATYEFTAEDVEYRTRTNRQPDLPDMTGDDVIHCFDAKTGKTLWRRVFGRKGRLICGEGLHLTVCYADGRIYAPGSAGALYCVDAASGEPVWEARVEPQAMVDGKWKGTTITGAPQVIDGVVVLGHGGRRPAPLQGFDARTGKKLWTGPSIGKGQSPVVWLHDGKGYFVAVSRKGLMLIEPRSGKILWGASMPDNATPHQSSSPAVSGNRLVMLRMNAPAEAKGQTKETRPVCFEISPTGCKLAWTGATVVRRAIGNADFSTPIIYHDRVYVAHDGAVRCHALADGKLLASMATSRRTTGMKNTGFNGMAVEGRLLCSDIHNIAMLSAAPDDLRLLSKVDRPGPERDWQKANSTSLGYGDGFIYMRTEQGKYRASAPNKFESRLVCYDLRAR